MFDFGTHANDFLVRREESLATETFLVRVPGGGAVPEHVHTDMEQTFVFVSGVGEATLSRGGEQARRLCCVPGDVVFVPAGWRHTVLAQSVEGLVSLTVNSFVPGADRVGASAVAHAVAIQPSFRATERAPRLGVSARRSSRDRRRLPRWTSTRLLPPPRQSSEA